MVKVCGGVPGALRGDPDLSNYGDPAVVERMVQEAVAWQDVQRINRAPLLTDEALAAKMGVSPWWVAKHVPTQHRLSRGRAPKRQKPAEPVAMAEAAITGAPAAPVSTEPAKPKLSYQKGASCGRGKHNWTDHGGYYKCPTCNSTKTKRAPKAPEASAGAQESGAAQPPSLLTPEPPQGGGP